MTKSVPMIPLKTYFDLEAPIRDLELNVDVLFALCGHKLGLTGNVTFSEAEVSRIHFMLCNTVNAVRSLKATYYSEVAS